MRIEGLPGEYVVLDKMNKRWSRTIDVYMGDDVAAAREFGRRDVTIRWNGKSLEGEPLAAVSSPPPADDLEATVRWLRDRELIKNLYRRYAYGVDSIDFDLVRTVFHPDCVCVGTAEQGELDEYLYGME